MSKVDVRSIIKKQREVRNLSHFLSLGLIFLLYTMFVWWRDVLRESTLDDSSKKFIKSFWRKLDAKGDQEAADEDYIAYQEAAHDYKIPNYIGLTGKLSKEVMDKLEASALKLGFRRGSYVDSKQFQMALRAAVGVDVFMSILPAPFRKTPYLSEINVANVEVASDKWKRVNHPLAYAVEAKDSKLFFYY